MRRILTIVLAGLVALPLAATAQIKLGIAGPLEGKNAGSMLEIVKGAEIYINQTNQSGGVNGQRIQLVARDDNFEVAKTVAVVTRLIEQDQVTALMLVRGTPHNQAILPLVAKHQIPLIGPSTGAMVFHQPVNKYVFNVRTAYQLEAEKLQRVHQQRQRNPQQEASFKAPGRIVQPCKRQWGRWNGSHQVRKDSEAVGIVAWPQGRTAGR